MQLVSIQIFRSARHRNPYQTCAFAQPSPHFSRASSRSEKGFLYGKPLSSSKILGWRKFGNGQKRHGSGRFPGLHRFLVCGIHGIRSVFAGGRMLNLSLWAPGMCYLLSLYLLYSVRASEASQSLSGLADPWQAFWSSMTIDF
jgi:hypothetical protein